MKLKYSSISDLDEQKLMTSIIVLFLRCEGKRYYVGNVSMDNIGVG